MKVKVKEREDASEKEVLELKEKNTKENKSEKQLVNSEEADLKNNSNEVNKPKRDITIDLIRIVASIIVIATHLTLTTYNIYEVQVDWSRLFTKCFLADGVAIFFLITGFFISNGRSYKKILKSTVKNIILPSFIILVLSEIFSKFIINQATIMECIKNFGMEDIKILAISIFKGEAKQTIPVAAHLWYIYAYIQIIILVPVLQLMCKDSKESKLARRIAMSLCILNIVLRDIQKFVVLPIGNIEVFGILDEKLLIVLLGYELYCKKDIIKNNKKYTFLGLGIFVLINIIRYKAEMQYMIINHIVKEEAFLGWENTFGIISAVALFIGIYSFDIKNEFLCKIITWLSSLTFGIYLVHFMLIAKIDIYKFEKISTVKFEILYMVLGTALIFIASLIITFIIKKVLSMLKNIRKALISK